MITREILAGDNLYSSIESSIALSRYMDGEPVQFKFNGVTVVVNEYSKYEFIAKKYQSDLKANLELKENNYE